MDGLHRGMKTFSEWLKDRDLEVYNEILGTLALGTAAAGLIAPKLTGRALKYIAKKGVDVTADVGSHVAKKAIDLGADAVKGGVRLAGRGIKNAAIMAAGGLKRGVAGGAS